MDPPQVAWLHYTDHVTSIRGVMRSLANGFRLSSVPARTGVMYKRCFVNKFATNNLK